MHATLSTERPAQKASAAARLLKLRGAWCLGSLVLMAILAAGCAAPDSSRSLDDFLELTNPAPASSASAPQRAISDARVQPASYPLYQPPGALAPPAGGFGGNVQPQRPDAEALPAHQTPGQPVGQGGRPVRLSEVIQVAYNNSEIIRDRAGFLSANNRLLQAPESLASSYDVPLQQTSGQSVEAALAAFDAQVALGVQWGQNALIQGNRFRSSNITPSDLLATNNGSFFARYDKPLARGGLFSLIPTWNYTLNNLPGRSFNSQFAGFMRAEYRQPLLAGRGAEFTEIAGPLSYQGGAMGRGVALAEIDEHAAMIQFDAELQRLAKQVEELYWDLWAARQVLASHVAARDSAYEIWQRVQRRAQAGLDGGGAADAAEAEESFHLHRNRADAAAADVAETDARLKRLVGLSPHETPPFRPVDSPGQARIVADWNDAYARAISSRTELRRAELWLTSLQLQLKAAENLTLPQLDLVTGLQANGLGDEVTGLGTNGLFDSDHLGWNAGLEFSMPLDLRREKLRVRNLQLRISKAHAAVMAQQEEIGHEVAFAIRNMDRWHGSLESATARLNAAQRRVAAVQADYDAGRAQLDRLLNSQMALADAASMRAKSVAQYNKAVAEFHFRRGDLAAQHFAGSAFQTASSRPLP